MLLYSQLSNFLLLCSSIVITERLQDSRKEFLDGGAVPVFGVCEQLVYVVQHDDGAFAW